MRAANLGQADQQRPGVKPAAAVIVSAQPHITRGPDRRKHEPIGRRVDRSRQTELRRPESEPLVVEHEQSACISRAEIQDGRGRKIVRVVHHAVVHVVLRDHAALGDLLRVREEGAGIVAVRAMREAYIRPAIGGK